MPSSACAIVALLLAGTTGALAQPQRPLVTVRPCGQPPLIDGRIDAVEWEQACAIADFTAVSATSVADAGTSVFACYDEKALYFAIRCAEPDPALPRGLRRAHDDRAFEDDCVQVFIAPEDLDKARTAEVAFGGYDGAYNTWFTAIQTQYEFTVNCEGSTTDARNDVRDWDAPWQAADGRETGAWTAELAIPFESLGIAEPPSDALWGLNILRNRNAALTGWVCEAFGGYRPMPFGAMALAPQGAVVRREIAAAPVPGPNTLAIAMLNPTAEPLELSATLWAGNETPATATTELAPGASETLEVPYTFAGRGNLKALYEVRQTGADVPLLAGRTALSLPPDHTLSLRYFAIPSYVEAAVHVEPDSAVSSARLVIAPRNAAPSEQTREVKTTGGAILKAPVAGEPGDTFSVELQVLDAAGKIVDRRTADYTVAEKPSWLGTQAGLPTGVLPPWTPLEVEGKTVSMLGKRYVFDGFALPAAVESAGAQLLAAPSDLSISIGGEEVAWTSRHCTIRESSAEQAVVESTWESEQLTLQAVSTLEYDGFSWNELTLRPRGEVEVDRVALRLPMRPEVCRYAYQGHAQAAHALSPLGLRAPLSANLWLGDEERGIAWLTEGLHWVRSQDRGRQVQVLPGPQATVWTSTFIDTPTKLTAPYTAQFALHVTPSKPIGLSKSRIYHGGFYGIETAAAKGGLSIPLRDRLATDEGTIEMWVRPNFDPAEVYDEQKDRSAYNRTFLSMQSSSGDLVMLYYNADDRGPRLVTRNAQGQYPLALSSPRPIPAGRWSYVAVSWGKQLRLQVNDEVAVREIEGLVEGSFDQGTLTLELDHFDVDDLRLSTVARDLGTVPEQSASLDAGASFVEPCEEIGDRPCALTEGRFGSGFSSAGRLLMDELAAQGKRIVIFHESWSRFQGYPDLEQVDKLKPIADACHRRGMLFLVYFSQHISDATPEWPLYKDDLLAIPERMWYQRSDVPQDCYVACTNGPYADLLLAGIEKLADEVGIDGVYMDGTTVAWPCANPSHPGCCEALANGTYVDRCPIRGTRQFMKRLRAIFARRGEKIFLDAHTGGAINIATQSFCDGYYDGEQLSRFRSGYRLSPDIYLTGYMGKQFGFRGDFLPNRHTMDQAIAIAAVHDTAVRGQPAKVDLAWAPYEDEQTTYVPYWEPSELCQVAPAQVLGSLYVKPDRALLVLGSQTEEDVDCTVGVVGLLAKLPQGVQAFDAISREPLALVDGTLSLRLHGRMWRMVEFRQGE